MSVLNFCVKTILCNITAISVYWQNTAKQPKNIYFKKCKIKQDKNYYYLRRQKKIILKLTTTKTDISVIYPDTSQLQDTYFTWQISLVTAGH